MTPDTTEVEMRVFILLLAFLGLFGCEGQHDSGKEPQINVYLDQARQGDPTGQLKLGILYEQGNGIVQDYKQAMYWYHKAAQQGNADAQFHLGAMFDEGKGVFKNRIEAMKWYRKAAEQGHAKSQNNLGTIYKEGQDVPQNYTQSVTGTEKRPSRGMQKAKVTWALCTLKVKVFLSLIHKPFIGSEKPLSKEMD